MSYLTARKRAEGQGSAREGTMRHWAMTKSSVGLLILTPFFLFTFGGILGAPHEEVLAYFARPFPAIVAGLMIVAGFWHFKTGIQMVIEDYVHGTAREYTIVATTCLSYAAIGVGLFALARLAL